MFKSNNYDPDIIVSAISSSSLGQFACLTDNEVKVWTADREQHVVDKEGYRRAYRKRYHEEDDTLRTATILLSTCTVLREFNEEECCDCGHIRCSHNSEFISNVERDA